jgi:hypothetical protein
LKVAPFGIRDALFLRIFRCRRIFLLLLLLLLVLVLVLVLEFGARASIRTPPLTITSSISLSKSRIA